MFNNIAGRYDFMNHFLSAGIDMAWRKKAINCLRKHLPETVLDIATGTGDFAIETLRLNPEKVVGIDISEGMLDVGRKKIERLGHQHKIELQQADSENLPFETQTFDAITVGFGVRNFENLEKGLSEMLRVLNPGGVAVILEFSKPKKFPVKQGYHLYSNHVIPALGKLLAKDNAAYTYLPESVAAFPEGEDFLQIMQKTGYNKLAAVPLTGGIATIYLGSKA